MSSLQEFIEQLARVYQVSEASVKTLVVALLMGNGRRANFVITETGCAAAWESGDAVVRVGSDVLSLRGGSDECSS